MTLSVISADSTALDAGLPFSVTPIGCSFVIPLGQEADGTFRPLQSTAGTLDGTGGGSGGGTASSVTLAAGTASIGTVALSSGSTVALAGAVSLGAGASNIGTVAVSNAVATTEPDVRGTLTVASATANAAATVMLANGVGTVGFTVSGLTASGATLAVEGSNDGGNTWSAVNTVSAGTGTLSSSLAADGQFSVAGAGRTALRLRVSAVGTGTVTVVSSASVGTRDVALAAPLPPGSNTLGTVTALPSGTQAVSGTLALSTGSTVAVTGTFWQVTQPVSGTFWQSTQPVSLSALPALPAGSNSIGTIAISGGTLSVGSVGGTVTTTPAASGTQTVAGTLALSAGSAVALATGTASVGTFSLASYSFTLAAGSANIGTVTLASNTFSLSAGSTISLGAGTSNIGTIAGSSANVPVYLAAVSSGGCLQYSVTNAASSSIYGTVKASGSNIMGYDVSNSGTAGAWVRIYSATTGTLGVGTPAIRLYVPPASARAAVFDLGSAVNGIIVAATAAAADSDTSTFTAANQVMVNIFYK